MKKHLKKVKIGSKSGRGGVPLPRKESMPVDKRGGPANASGFKSISSGKKKLSNEKVTLGVEKASIYTLNTGMKQKSAFDTFFEEVMSNPADLGAGPDSPADDIESLDLDPGLSDDAGGDEVTLTLPRSVAMQLHDLLSAQISGEEDMSDEELGAEDLGADIGGEEDTAEDEDNAFGEAVKSEPAPKPMSKTAGKNLMSKGSMKAPSTLKPGGKATDKASLDVQAEPKKLSNTGKELQGKDNKVNASKMPKPGQNMFD